MKNSRVLSTVAILLAGTVAAGAQDRVVNVYNWSDYIDDEILAEFTAETGIQVVYDVYDSNEMLETRLLAGGSGYDVVVPTASFLSRQIAAGVYQELDQSKLTNIGNMWDLVTERTAVFDPDNAYSVNYMWGTNGIGYNVGKVQEILGEDSIDSWSVVFDPEIAAQFADCGIHMLDSPIEIFPAMLAYLGRDPNSTSAEDIAAAEEALMQIRPFVEKFHSSEYINGLANGDICLAIGYSGDVFQARDRAAEAEAGVEVGYAIPVEGAEMWFDQLAIPADAGNVEEAHEFINYLMQPGVIAKASNYVYYANGNEASQEFLVEDVIGDPAIYPPAEAQEKLFTKPPYDAQANRLITRAWTRVKSGQ
ncbi:polyamine ABC transporter substrate-binding protein [Rhizobium sp. EC-SD404]|uniref:polyamine ABC transporter substrate-binding protein n=1 Tax=Rhizobium sp. EC-SD404 TaxID=2038389 RepID=UPI00125C4B13|nr:polyamine ABC transporter substrate-binding protein [Rhizobium sp. EC-SD404]VVT32037.1 putrescine transporter subunit: periplasmic-binding component of ABC superfamily [Rhizobium sp. EC-SD404]